MDRQMDTSTDAHTANVTSKCLQRLSVAWAKNNIPYPMVPEIENADVLS